MVVYRFTGLILIILAETDDSGKMIHQYDV